MIQHPGSFIHHNRRVPLRNRPEKSIIRPQSADKEAEVPLPHGEGSIAQDKGRND